MFDWPARVAYTLMALLPLAMVTYLLALQYRSHLLVRRVAARTGVAVVGPSGAKMLAAWLASLALAAFTLWLVHG